MADGIMQLLENPDLAEYFVERGKEIVKEFTWDGIIEKHITAYARVIKVDQNE